MAEKKESETKVEMAETLEEVLGILQQEQQPAENEAMNIDEVVSRLEGALDALNTQMDEIYKNTGMTREQLEEYASNPENFSEDEWSLINQIRGQLGKFEEEAEEAKLGMPEIHRQVDAEGEAAEKSTKKKKSGRRKNWLQS